jgi:hypothetical protein
MTNYTIAFWEANQSTLDAGPNFNIDDTGANIQAALNALNGDSHITQIIISDNASVVLNVAKISSDATALSKLINQNGTAAHLTVRDTAAHIGNGFATIGTSSQVTSVVISDNAVVTLTASQVENNQNVLGELVNANASPVNVTLKDTAAHIQTDGTLDIVEANLSTITSVVVSNSAVMTLTASQIANDAGALAIITNNNSGAVTFKVADTGANIGAHLDALQANAQITTITDTDNSAINLNIAQFTSDAGALAKIVDADASPVSFHVSDTAANISSAFNSLNSNASVTKITVTDSATNEVTITAAQAGSDTAALGELVQADGTTPAKVAVSDTAANVSSALDALNSNTHVDKIVISPSGALTLTAGQVATDTTALSEIQGSYTIHVTDTAANVTTNLNGLQTNGHVTQIVISDNAEITVTVAQLSSDAGAISDIQNANSSAVHVIVADTANNISNQSSSLNINSLVNKIIVTDSATDEVSLSAGQAGADTTLLGELFNADGTTPAHVSVHDTAANVASHFDALSGNGHVNKIIVIDGAQVTITAAQAGSDGVALGELVGSDGTTHVDAAVSDTAANISGAFAALNGNTNINKIIVSDSATHEVTITAAQAAADTTALSELFLANGTTAAHVAVGDTAANISAAFDALNSNSHLDRIIITDSATNFVKITAAQAASDTTALNELRLADGTTAAHVAVQDTAADISAAIDALNSNSHVTTIIVSDSATNQVIVSVAQAAADSTALNELRAANGTSPAPAAVQDVASAISSAFDALNLNTTINKIIVSDSGTNEVTITVSQAATDSFALGELVLANGTTQAHVAVGDTAANISAAFNTLTGDSQVNKIIVSDSATNEVTITVAQLGSDITALSELFQANGTMAAHVAIGDTAANIASAFDTLNANSQANKIIVSDSATNEVTITVAQAAADTTALGELFLANGTTAAHVAVQDTAANVSSAFDALNANSHVNKVIVSDSASNEVTLTASQAASDGTALSELFLADGTTAAHVAVQDTAANISSAFNALDINSHVNKIIVSNSGSAEVTISASQAASDTGALNELFNSDGSTPASVAVSDLAATISSDFAALNGNTHVNKIIVSDSATNEVTISVATLGATTTALNELYNSNGTTPAHVAISDTASDISTAFTALNGNSHVNKIVVSDSASHEVTITVAQLGADGTALAELFNADGTTAAHVTITDTAANISASFDTLNSNAQVDHITISPSSSLTLTAGQVATDTTALGEITNGSYSILVTDSAANVTTNLDALQSNGHVSGITISDNAEITVSIAQLASDAGVIGDISNANSSPVHVIVSDTAAAIATDFDALSGNSLVNKIVVSDSATNEVTITAAQAAGDVAALSELVQANGVSEAFVAVQDTASAITSALDALSGNTFVNKIIVSDSATHEVSITVAQLSTDSTALGELYDADGTTLAFVIVNDTAANISAALDTLESSGRMNKVVVSDSATHEVVASVAQLTSDAGVLANLFNANGTTAANVTVSDTAANISGDLDALNGDTQVNHIIISDNGAITVSVAQATGDATAIGELQNQNGGPVSLTVQDTAANIAGALDALNGETNISSIVISDNAPLTLTAIEVGTDTSALAKLHNLNGSGVQIDVVDTAAHISANLQALQDNPDVVSIIVSDNAPITVTVAQITSDALVLSELQNANSSPVLLTVDDTATNIRANLASLNQNSEISSIVISNNGVLLLSIAQLTTDAHALSIMINANGSPYTVRISDIASNISASLDMLNANSHVKTITVTDSGAIALSVAQITSDATALSELVNANSTAYKLSVHDTAANISTAFNALNGNSHVSQIVVSDSATNEVLLTAGQFASDITALAELFKADGTTQAHVNVADTAANVTTALNSLVSSQADKITVTDSATNEVVVSIAQITSDAAALAKLYNANGSTPANVEVSDTASDITAALNSLNSNSQVNKIVVSDSATNEVTVSIAQITSDAHALGELFVADGSVRAHVVVNDTAANITTALDSLSGNPSLVNKIVVSDSASNEVTVSIAQITSDANGLSELFNANGTTHANVTVSDIAATVSSNFNALNANSQVNKIVVSDSATNEVTLLAAQIAGDATALAELFQANGTTLANVKVSDTASDISAVFDTLNGSSQVNKIVVTDSSGHEVTISIAQLGADTAALNELYQSDGTTLAKVAVSDTAANISAVLAQLGSNSHVDHIIISDGQALTLTVSQLVNNTAALGEIVGPYSVIVSDTGAHISANLDALEANPSVVQLIVSDNHDVVVSIAQLSSDASVLSVMMDANGLSPASLRISDTAANIQANLGNLEADTANHNIHVITISDNGAISLSASQFTADSVVLGDLRNANATQVQLSMSDTAAHVQAVLDQIEAYNTANGSSKISSIVISNSAQLTITAEQLHDDASVLAEITNRNGAPVTFKVVDTAANITTNLGTLESNAAHLSTIVVSDNAAIAVNVAQITADADAIALLKNQNMTAYSLTVTDTAGHVQSSLALLNSDSHVDKIVVSDSATNEVHFTVAQVTHDTNVLGELYNADGTTHASIELVDSAGHIQAMTATQIAALAGDGVNIIDSTNNKLMLAVAQYEALGTVQLTQADSVSISDTGAHISAMTASELAGLSAEGVDRIVTTDHQVTFTADQWSALSVGVDSQTTITVNGTSGNDTINASSINAFVLNGGGGADTFTVSTGHDVFVYGAASDSTGPTFDTIIGLDTTRDVFHLNSAVTGIDTAVNSGMLDSGANFNAELAADIGSAQLGAGHAVLFTATSGNLAGHTFLIVDTNGVAGYQAGADLVIDVTGGHHLTGLSTSDFITG